VDAAASNLQSLVAMAVNQTRVADPETYAVIGAAMAVHTELGCGFLEAVYRAAMVVEFNRRGVPFECEVPLSISYKGVPLTPRYRVDFVCFDSVLVEVKAAQAISSVDLAQAINYLKASGRHRALLLNFGARSLEHRRVVWSRSDCADCRG
jgi:GxxExxY protein